MIYVQKNWYWQVAGNATQVYSSSADEFVALTDAAYSAWLASGGTPTKISANDMLLLRIDWLEATATPRRLREAATGTDNGWLAALNTEISALRAQLT